MKGRVAALRQRTRMNGMCVAKKELDTILEAEKSAAQAIEGARAKAKEILAKSEKAAEQLLQDSLESAQTEARSLSRRSAETVTDLEKDILRETQQAIAGLRATANGTFDEAVDIIVSRVKRAV